MIDTDDSIADMRADLSHRSSSGAVSIHMIRALEVVGIAKALVARFSTSHHQGHAKYAYEYAARFSARINLWLSNHDIDHEARDFRVYLLTQLDWVHVNCSSPGEDAASRPTSCLSPLTAYLQFIIWSTPQEDWATALKETNAGDWDASPLAFALTFARKSPTVGRQTADVATLVAMGRHVARLIGQTEVNLQQPKSGSLASYIRLCAHLISSAPVITGLVTLLPPHGVSAAMDSAFTVLVGSAAANDHCSPDQRRRSGNRPEARDDGATLQTAAEMLLTVGDQYAHVLREEQRPGQRDHLAAAIRSQTELLLSNAADFAPESAKFAPEYVLPAIASLAKAEA